MINFYFCVLSLKHCLYPHINETLIDTSRPALLKTKMRRERFH